MYHHYNVLVINKQLVMLLVASSCLSFERAIVRYCLLVLRCLHHIGVERWIFILHVLEFTDEFRGLNELLGRW